MLHLRKHRRSLGNARLEKGENSARMLQCRYEVHISKNDTYSMDKPHFHEDVEIVLCVSGEGLLFIGNTVFPLHRGQLFFINSSVLHRSVANEEYRCMVFHVSPQMLQVLSSPYTQFSTYCCGIGQAVTLTGDDINRLETLFSGLMAPKEIGFGADLNRVAEVINFLVECFSHFAKAGKPQARTNPGLEKVAPILEYIQDHLDEPLTTASIAEAFYMSKHYLCHLFKEHTGFSLIDYVINCRVLKARGLLRQGMRVQEAGERSGFQSNEHFIRTFKKLTGVTPKRYGMMYREIDLNMKQEVVTIKGQDGRLVESIKA